MTRSRAIASGAAALVAAQVILAGGQLAYTAVTSRILAPEAFGSYAVALAATGVVGLAFAALPAALVALPDLDSGAEAALQWLGRLLGLVAGVLLVVAAPLWAALWGSEESVSLTRLLSIQVAIAAPGAVALAQLRRSGRTMADASAQVIGGLLGFLVGGLAVAFTESPLALAVNPIMTAGGQYLIGRTLRGPHRATGSLRGGAPAIRFAANIALQGAGFYLLISAVPWFISRTADDASLGQFTRAALLVGLPASAITNALTRSLQPYYRHLSDYESRSSAVSDATILTAALTFSPFGLLILLSGPITELVLGPGWSMAGSLAKPLAAGYGVYTVFSVLANAAETMGYFKAVRRSQMAMGATLLGILVLGRELGSTYVASWGMLGIGTIGVAAMLVGLDRQVLAGTALARAICVEAIVAAGIVGCSCAVATWLANSGYLRVALAVPLTAIAYLSVNRGRPPMEVAQRRNLLPSAFKRLS